MNVTLFTSSVVRTENHEELSASQDKTEHADPHSVVFVHTNGVWISIHVDFPARGREIAAAILQACEETETERARRAAKTEPVGAA